MMRLFTWLSTLLMRTIVCIYPTTPPRKECETGEFFSRVELVWIQSFPFPRLVGLLPLGGGHWHKIKCKHLHQVFDSFFNNNNC